MSVESVVLNYNGFNEYFLIVEDVSRFAVGTSTIEKVVIVAFQRYQWQI